MNYWVKHTEKPEKVLDSKVFKSISVSNPLLSAVVSGSTESSEIVLESPGSQIKNQRDEEFGFVASLTSMTLWHASAQDTEPIAFVKSSSLVKKYIRWLKQILKALSYQTWVFMVFDCKLPKNKDHIMYWYIPN